MKHSIYTNQKAIVELGITGIDFNHMALFEFCRGVINWSRSVDTEVNGTKYKWVSYKMILDHMPMLDVSTKTLYRMIEKLCEADLLERCPENSKKNMVFLGFGVKGIELAEYVELNSINNDTSVLTSDKNVRGVSIVSSNPGQKCPTTPDKNVRLLIEDNNKLIINSIDTIPTDAGIVKPKKSKVKTTNEAAVTDFYENEIRLSLDSPIPPEFRPGAERRGITEAHLSAAYAEMVRYMTEPSDAWPGGMWSWVLKRPYQLSFEQYVKLVLKLGMRKAEILAYLDSWQNKKYKNDSIYATFCNWKAKELERSSTGSNDASKPSTVASTPKGGYQR